MKWALVLSISLMASYGFTDSVYKLTEEEFRAGLAIRDSDSDESVDLVATSVNSETARAGYLAGFSDSVTGMGGSSGFGGWLPASIAKFLQASIPVLTAAVPIVAQVTAAALAMAAVIKLAEPVLVAATTVVCKWLGFDLATSATLGLAMPEVVKGAAGWIKGRLFA